MRRAQWAARAAVVVTLVLLVWSAWQLYATSDLPAAAAPDDIAASVYRIRLGLITFGLSMLLLVTVLMAQLPRFSRPTGTRQAEEPSVWKEAIAEASFDGVILVDSAGLIRTFGNGAEQIFGYRAPELIGQNLLRLFPSGAERTGSAAGDSLDDPSSRVTGRCKNGDEIALDLRMARIPVNGETRSLIVVRRPESPQRAEETSIDARTLAVAMDCFTPAVVILAREGMISLCNRSCELLTGRPRSSLLGVNFAKGFCNPADAGFVRKQIAALSQETSPIQLESELPIHGALPVLIQWTLAATEIPGGAHEIVAVGERVGRLEAAGATGGSSSELVATEVARLLNHHLTSILGYSDLLMETVRSDDPMREGLAEIQSAGHRIAELASALEDIGHSQQEGTDAVDVHEALAAYARGFPGRLSTGRVLMLGLDAGRCVAMTNVWCLEQALDRLLRLAVRFAPAGDALIIRTSNETADGGRQSLVLDLFHAGDSGGRAATDEGPYREDGLDLATAHCMVSCGGGVIDAASCSAHGVAFRIRLPLHTVATRPSRGAELHR